MSKKNETIADIVREIREQDGEMMPSFVCFAEDGGLCMSSLADRIEAAWKRERGEVEQSALSVGGIVEALRRSHERNCDRFADAMKAYGGYLDEGNEGEIDSAHFLAWLFAPAKEEAHDDK